MFQFCAYRENRYSMYWTYSWSQLKWALISALHYRVKFIPAFERYILWYLVYFKAVNLIITILFSCRLPLFILIGCLRLRDLPMLFDWHSMFDFESYLILGVVCWQSENLQKGCYFTYTFDTRVILVHIYCHFLRIWLKVLVQKAKYH